MALSGFDILSIVFAVCALTLAVACTMVTIHFGKELFSSKSRETSLSIRVLCLTTSIFICLTMFLIIVYVPGYQLTNGLILYSNIGIVCRFLYSLDLSFIIIIAELRLRYALKNTAFQLPKYIFIIIWCLFVIGIICGSILGTIGRYLVGLKLSLMFAIIGLIIYGILIAWIVVLFVKSLLKVKDII